MPRPIFAHVRAILLLGLALSVSFLAPSPALAQEDCEIPLPGHQLTKPLCNFDPMVTLSPGDVYVSQPWVPVRVEAWDYLEYLDTASFAVRVDGVDVTGTFGRTTRFEGAPPITRWHRTAVGLVGLSESDPVREVSAELCDTYQGMQLCTTREAEYRLSLPGVEVSPKGGTNHSLASQGIARTFTVTNQGTLEATFALTPQCVELRTGEAVTPCTLDVATVTLSPGGSQVVNLSHGMRVGDELRVTVEASAVGQPGVRDSGWRVVSVFGAVGAGGGGGGTGRRGVGGAERVRHGRGGPRGGVRVRSAAGRARSPGASDARPHLGARAALQQRARRAAADAAPGRGRPGGRRRAGAGDGGGDGGRDDAHAPLRRLGLAPGDDAAGGGAVGGRIAGDRPPRVRAGGDERVPGRDAHHHDVGRVRRGEPRRERLRAGVVGGGIRAAAHGEREPPSAGGRGTGGGSPAGVRSTTTASAGRAERSTAWARSRPSRGSRCTGT